MFMNPIGLAPDRMSHRFAPRFPIPERCAPRQRRGRAVLTVATVFLITVGAACAGDSLPVRVENAWVRAVPPASEDSVAFFTVINAGDRSVRLVGGSCSVSQMAHVMVTTREGKEGKVVMGMKIVPSLEIAPHGRLELRPDGDHLMLMGLTSHPNEGDKVELTLRFEPDSMEVNVEASVLKK
jgi:copper(I)-binding protein